MWCWLFGHRWELWPVGPKQFDWTCGRCSKSLRVAMDDVRRWCRAGGEGM